MKRVLVIPGLPRCATTSFAQTLNQHPDIFLPHIKEPHYLLPDKSKYFMFNKAGKKTSFKQSGFVTSEAEWLSLYDNFKEDKVYIDASTLYAVHHGSMDVLHKQKDIDPYFIILTRNPFKRALSHYLYSVSRGEEFRTFEQTLDDELEGKYKDWLLGGYLAGSLSTGCEEKILKYWGSEKLITASIDNENIFGNDFLKTITTMLGIPELEFSTDVHANSLTVTNNKFLSAVRIGMKRVRQINPHVFDNKLTRFVFNKFISNIQSDKDLYKSYAHLETVYIEKLEYYKSNIIQ